MANNITYKIIEDISDLDQLLGKTSTYNEFVYTYDQKTVDLLKKNFTLPDSLYLLAQESGAFAGFVSCDRDWWENNCFFLREIFVAPAYQGQGIGNSMALRCVEHARHNSADTLVTQTAYENIPMQRLCEQLGFVAWDNPQWSEGITYKLTL